MDRPKNVTGRLVGGGNSIRQLPMICEVFVFWKDEIGRRAYLQPALQSWAITARSAEVSYKSLCIDFQQDNMEPVRNENSCPDRSGRNGCNCIDLSPGEQDKGADHQLLTTKG